MPTATATLGQRVKEYRFSHDLTQTQMAIYLGVGRRTICRLEAGEDLGERLTYKLEQQLKKRGA